MATSTSGNFISVIYVAVTILYQLGFALPAPGNTECVKGDVAVWEKGVCAREYLVCHSNVWRRAMCVGTVFNTTSSRCIPYNEACPDPGFIDRAFTGRRKREVLDCNKSFYCPLDLTNIFIYPDWSNTACDSYVVCFKGTLLVSSCKTDGYKYYNPRRLSCEEVSSQSNTCLYRLNTDLSPLF